MTSWDGESELTDAGNRHTAATLIDVANAAGVSLATASRVLNGSARQVRAEYRERVLAAAGRLNYAPNVSAQAVARGRSNAIGVVVSDIADPYFSAIAAGILHEADSAGLITTIAISERVVSREIDLVTALRGQRPRGIIMVGSRTNDDELTERLRRELIAFAEDGGRIALVSQAGLPFDTISFENREGARELAAALVRRGYRRFAVFAGPENLLTARERLDGFAAGLDELRAEGVEVVAVIHSDFTRDGGYLAASELIDRGIPAELVFAVNDVMAVGAMARLREAGVGLPHEVAVAGFDDIATLRDISPALTTVRLPLEEAGAAAVRMLLGAGDASGDATRKVPLPGVLVIRDSTPPR